MRLPRISVVIASLVLCACLVGVGLNAQQPQQAPAPAPAAAEPDQGASIRQNVNLVDVLFTVFN
ncbi:MAG TPA: hypothetical protein VGG55_03690, partial [Candidatus Acidoferrales bacterium]